jgi:hypothetical protein
VTKNRVEAVAELIMESKFGMIDAVEEMVTKGIKQDECHRGNEGGKRRKGGYRV